MVVRMVESSMKWGSGRRRPGVECPHFSSAQNPGKPTHATFSGWPTGQGRLTLLAVDVTSVTLPSTSLGRALPAAGSSTSDPQSPMLRIALAVAHLLALGIGMGAVYARARAM